MNFAAPQRHSYSYIYFRVLTVVVAGVAHQMSAPIWPLCLGLLASLGDFHQELITLKKIYQ